MREWRAKNPDKVKVINKRNYWKTHTTRRKSAKDQATKLRDSIFLILGTVCVECGYDDKRALQFDHVNGGGLKDTKRFKGHQTMLRYYRDNPEICKKKLQILCANCNWIKKHDNDEVTEKKYDKKE
jgi:hypothetical protein